jgi:hypothetical protein
MLLHMKNPSAAGSSVVSLNRGVLLVLSVSSVCLDLAFALLPDGHSVLGSIWSSLETCL